MPCAYLRSTSRWRVLVTSANTETCRRKGTRRYPSREGAVCEQGHPSRGSGQGWLDPVPTWCFDQGRVLQTPVAVNATHSMHTNHRVGQAQYRTSSCKQCQVRTILWALTQKVRRSNARRSRGEGRAGGSVPLKGDRDENSSNLIFQGQESML